ncbi:MAG: hypothetical protein Q9201_005208 [Fulgogasparrea decipioides]
MKYFLALAAAAVAVSAQNPPGCVSDSPGTFVIQPINITAPSPKLTKRQARTICGSTPIVTLKGGVLTDQQGRTGEVVANSQFQFDNPTQADALFTSGFSICQNGTLAVGGSAIFYQCLNNPTATKSAFFNLYSQSQGPQCNASYINTIQCDAGPGQSGSQSGSTSAISTTSLPGTISTSASVPSTPPTTPTPVPTTAPYPVGNTTVPASSGTGAGPGPTTSTPAPFVPGSGAATLIVGGKVFALLAGIAAFAMF